MSTYIRGVIAFVSGLFYFLGAVSAIVLIYQIVLSFRQRDLLPHKDGLITSAFLLLIGLLGLIVLSLIRRIILPTAK